MHSDIGAQGQEGRRDRSVSRKETWCSIYRDIGLPPILIGFFSIFYIWQPYDNSDKNINFVTPKVGKAAETPQKLVGKAAETPQKLVGKAAEMTKETNNMTHLYD